MDNEVKFKTQGCEEFEISPSDTLNLKSLEKNTKLNLKAVKYSVSGRVNSKERKISDLKVIAKSETRLVELELEPLENDVGYRSIIFRNSLLFWIFFYSFNYNKSQIISEAIFLGFISLKKKANEFSKAFLP